MGDNKIFTFNKFFDRQEKDKPLISLALKIIKNQYPFNGYKQSLNGAFLNRAYTIPVTSLNMRLCVHNLMIVLRCFVFQNSK